MATTVNKNRVSNIQLFSGVACLLLAVNTTPVASLPAVCELEISEKCFGPDDTSPIEITYKNECGKLKKKDKIAILPADKDDIEFGSDELWIYLCDQQKKCKKKPPASGTVSIADWITNDQTPSGEYKAYLLAEKSDEIKAETGVFTISKTVPCSEETVDPSPSPSLAPPPCEDQSGKFVLKPKNGKKGKKKACKWAKNKKKCNNKLEDGGEVKDVCPKKCDNCPTIDDREAPSAAPTKSAVPSFAPTKNAEPSSEPSNSPTISPSLSPSVLASSSPSDAASTTDTSSSTSSGTESSSGTQTE